MLTPPRRSRILKLALPIIGGMVSQNVLNLVDTFMVGGLGDNALAAVGQGGFANFLAASIVLGLSAGVQSMAARRVGEGRIDQAAVALNGGLLWVLLIAIPWSLWLYLDMERLFPLLNSDPGVVAEAVPYMRARVVGMTALGINFAFRGYWSAVDKPSMYLRTLVTMHVSNIFLNWVLIYGNLGAPALGATGSGVATTIAVHLGTLQYVVLGFREARSHGFLKAVPERATMLSMLRVSLPSSLQQVFFAAGMSAFLWVASRVDTATVAATSVVQTILLVAILPSLGFGLASASLVGQALGRGEPDDAKMWGWDVAKLAACATGAIALPAVVFPEQILSLFLRDADTLALAARPFRLVALVVGVDGIGLVLLNSLMGAGASRTAMLVSTLMQWCFGLPLAFVLGPWAGFGVLGLFAAQSIYRIAQTLVLAGIWRGGGWATAKV